MSAATSTIAAAEAAKQRQADATNHVKGTPGIKNPPKDLGAFKQPGIPSVTIDASKPQSVMAELGQQVQQQRTIDGSKPLSVEAVLGQQMQQQRMQQMKQFAAEQEQQARVARRRQRQNATLLSQRGSDGSMLGG